LVGGGDTAACELRETYRDDGAAHETSIAAFYTVAEGRMVRARVYRAGSADV
jgi:hypothetical protein